MENKTHKFISASYELYSIEYGNEVLIEKTEENRPLTFYTGCEMALPEFEKIAMETAAGNDFAFDLAKGQAYGDYKEENVLNLEKAVSPHEGEFDSSNVYVGAMIPLQNQEGQRFMARVIDITEDKVKVDLNHPLAGKELKFKGHIIENREASEEEVKEFFEKLNSHHCGGNCGCHGDGEGNGEGHCGCHGEGEGHGDGHCGCHGEGEGHGEGHCGCHGESEGHGGGHCGCHNKD